MKVCYNRGELAGVAAADVGVFRKLFNDKAKLIELYNALTGSNYPPDTEIEIVTLDDVIFGGSKNDLAFIIEHKLIILIEHQSTVSPNMPLRMGDYIFKQYEQLVDSNAIYSKRLVPLPTPEFYVFYNGLEDLPLETELKLSDSFMMKCDKLSLEVVVRVINVNYEAGAELLKRCQTLSQYSQFISMMREVIRAEDQEAAYRELIAYCIRHDILKDFLKKYGGEIMSFLFEALSREECEAIRAEDGYLEGLEAGRKDGLREGLREGLESGLRDSRLTIIQLVLAKLRNGQTPQQISEDLLQSIEVVKNIANAAEQNPDKTDMDLYQLLYQE